MVAITLGMLARPAVAEEATSDWERIQFIGHQSFSADQLREALIAEPDFLLATHPHGDKAGVREATRSRLLAGYQRAGFASPEIDVKTNLEHGVSVHISEGQRFYCGSVRVNGANQVDAQLLADRLTKPFSKKGTFPTFVETADKLIARWVDGDGTVVKQESPVWERGKPAPLNTEQKLNRAVQAAMADLGFSSTQVLVAITTNPSTSQAELVVDLLDEGMRDRVDTIDVTGSEINSRDQLLTFLNVEPGFTFDSSQQQRLTKQLWDSGRFTKHQLQFNRDKEGMGRLSIELADVPGVPPLTQPLSSDAQVFMKARRWLSGMNERGEDLVINFKNGGVQLQVIQSAQGMLVQIGATDDSSLDQINSEDEDIAAGESNRKTTFVVDRTHIGISHSDSPAVWKADVTGFRGALRLETKLAAAQSDTHLSHVNFNLNWHSERREDEPLLSQMLNLSPAGWCAFAYKKELRIETVANQLMATGETERMVIDVASGKISRWDSGSSTARVQAGLFEQMREQIVRENANKQNAYQAAQPVTSLIGYMVSEPCCNGLSDVLRIATSGTRSLNSPLRSAFEKLASAGLFVPLDAFALHTAQWSGGERFAIPDETTDSKDLKRWAVSLVGKYTLKCLPDLFAEGTWPMKVAREACLVAVQRGRHTNKVLKELKNDASTGPLCDASVACLLSLVGQPLAPSFATRSLGNLEPEKFDRDMNVLLSGPSGKWIARIVNGIASMSDSEIMALGKLFKGDRLGNALKVIQIHAKPPVANESLWYQAAHVSLEAKLREIGAR